MVLQDDRTSVPLPPNLYLLNQNQKFMKRTLHLTVMMLLVLIASVNRAYGQEEERVVLYESDFSEGADGWETSGNLPNGTLTYDAENKWLLYSQQRVSNSYKYKFSLLKRIDLNKTYYTDFQVSFEVCCNSSLKLYYYAMGELDVIPQTGNGVFTNTGILDVDKNTTVFTVGIQMEPESQIPAGSICIKSVKVTGVPLYRESNLDYITTKMSEIQYYPEGSTFKYTFDKATVVLSSWKGMVLTDGDGGMFIKSWGVMTDNIYTEMGRAFHGTIYGVITKKEGAPQVINGVLDIEQGEYESGNVTVKKIKEEEYYDHQCELVQMPISSDIYMWDYFDAYGPSRTVESPGENFYVTGIVFPNPDGSKRMILNWDVGNEHFIFSDDDYSEITESYIGYRLEVERQMEKDKWYTIVYPSQLNIYPNSWSDTYALFESCDDGVLTFKTINSQTNVPAGTPLLIKPKYNKTSFRSTIEITGDTPLITEGGDYNFVGTFKPVQPKDGSYYLSEGNTIRPLASGGTIGLFRAYFEPATPNVAMARSISIDGMTTAINDIEWDDGNPFLTPTDSRIYNLEGQMVGTNLEQLPKGMYIVNGKKVIK